MSAPKTLYDKIVDEHRILSFEESGGAGERLLLYIDRTVLNEYTSPQAFSGLRAAGRAAWRPAASLGVVDHVNSTNPDRAAGELDDGARRQIEYLGENGRDFGIEIFDLFDPRQGIEHVVMPELGLVLPGMVIAAGDSHSTTYGAFGVVGFGIGTSDIEHLLATQTLVYRRLKTMRITIDGTLAPGVTAKDMIMDVIRKIGADGATGHAVEFAGQAIDALGVEARMTICNMAVECGARVALMAPDDKVVDYISGCPRAPSTEMLALARADWRTLRSDPGARFDKEVAFDAIDIPPMVSWGTSPDQSLAITGAVPDPAELPAERRADAIRAMAYMDLAPHTPLQDIAIDRAFIGSCTNARLTDLRDAARILKGRKVAPGVRAMISPGSSGVRRAAEAEGIDRIFIDAGFEWRRSGCSLCLAMNDDSLAPGERCASSTNRNFEGRQGIGRTHLMSPAMVAAAAVTGRLADVRVLAAEGYFLMERFIRLSGRAAAMPAANIDTDVIMPKAYLKGIDRSGLAIGLFHDFRFDEDGAVRRDFILNRADMAETRFLIVGPNFGCGSSREHAVWGMLQYGIRGIIGSSYGAIFADNAANNGLLLLSLSTTEIAALTAELDEGAGDMTVDLETQRIEMGGYAAGFDIDPATRQALMLGLDRIGETLMYAERIRAFEKAYLGRKPWLMGADSDEHET